MSKLGILVCCVFIALFLWLSLENLLIWGRVTQGFASLSLTVGLGIFTIACPKKKI
jgi:hypothetical protein